MIPDFNPPLKVKPPPLPDIIGNDFADRQMCLIPRPINTIVV